MKTTMKRNGFVGLGFIALAAVAIIAVGASVFFGLKSLTLKSDTLGAAQSFQPVQAPKTNLSGAGITANATSVNLTSLLASDGVTPITNTNIGSTGFATIEPGVPKKEENISFTGITQNANGSAVLTGVTRGLLPVYPYTASTTLAIQHSGGVTLILSNSGAFYNQFNIAANTSTITGAWTYASTSIPSVGSDTTTSTFTTFNLIDKQYADNLSFAGAPNGSVSQKGIYQEATKSQLSAGTVVGSTGGDLIAPNAYFNASSSATTTVPVTDTAGKIDPSFINQASNYSFTGSFTTASTTNTGTSTFTNTVAPIPTNASSVANKAYVDAAIPQKVVSSTTSLSNSNVSTTIVGVPLATAGTGTLYRIDFGMVMGVQTSGTLFIVASSSASYAVLFTCAETSGSPTRWNGNGQITMQNSTTSQVNDIIGFSDGGQVTCSAAPTTAQMQTTANLATTTQLQMRYLGPAGTVSNAWLNVTTF